MDIITNLLAPFQYDFMVRATLVSALIGTVCAVLSCFLVLKGWSLMGDAISHAVLPGIVIALSMVRVFVGTALYQTYFVLVLSYVLHFAGQAANPENLHVTGTRC